MPRRSRVAELTFISGHLGVCDTLVTHTFISGQLFREFCTETASSLPDAF